MICRALLACLLVVGTQAFASGALHWRGSTRMFVVTPGSLPKKAAALTKLRSLPQPLVIRSRLGEKADEIPRFVAKADRTIAWEGSGMCLEAPRHTGEHEVLINHCTGGPTQLWNILQDEQGHSSQIRLEGSKMCAVVVADEEDDLNGAPVQLRECEDKAAEKWTFEEPLPLARKGHSQDFASSSSMAHVIIGLSAIVAIGALSISAWMWRRWKSAFVVTSPLYSSPLNVDNGGVCLTCQVRTPLFTNLNLNTHRTAPAVMVESPVPVSRRSLLLAAGAAVPMLSLGSEQADAASQFIRDAAQPVYQEALKRLGKIPGQYGGQYVAMDLAVGSQQLPVLIDTGFSGDLMITPAEALRLQATAKGSASTVTAYQNGSNMIVRVPGAILASQNGIVEVPPRDALVGNFPQAIADRNMQLGGMIGMTSLWEEYDVDLDLSTSKLRLYREGDGRKVATTAGMAAVKCLPVERYRIPAVRLLLPDGSIFLGIVDTGSSTTIANPAAAEFLGLKIDSSLGEFAGAGFAEDGVQEVLFEPGKLGFALDTNGAVSAIVPGGQADRLGVKEGWRINHLRNADFSTDDLAALAAGSESFAVTFRLGAPLSVTKVARGVPLRVDVGGWSPLENAFTLKPRTIAVSELKHLEAFVGAGNPAVILGLDVLGDRRLLFADGGKDRRTLFLGTPNFV